MMTAQPLQADAALVQHVQYDNAQSWQVGQDNLQANDIATRFQSRLSGDFNDDGIPDLLGTVDDQWWLQLNDGTQLFGVPWGDAPSEQADIIGTADFDGDGWLDVLARDQTSGKLVVHRNSETGFVAEPWGRWTTQVPWTNVTIGDFDNDGRPDVLASEPGGNWWLAKSYGDKFLNHHWGRFQNHNWQDIVSGDFNGDNYIDMAARGQDNTWWVWQGSADGFHSPQYFGHWKMQSHWQDVAAADFNGDGRDDLIGRSDDGRLWVGSATPDARFHTWTWATGWIDRAEWSDVKIVDVDADGLPDQVGRANDNTVWVARNTGEKLQNHFFGRAKPNADYVDYVPGFQRQEASDVSGFFPHIADALAKEGPGYSTDSEMRVTLNEQNQFVFHADGLELMGIDIQSDTGSLIPIADDSPEPFSFLLQNTHWQVTVGNVETSVAIDGSLTIPVGWDGSDPDAELFIQYGTPKQGSQPVIATLDFPGAPELETVVPLSVEPSETNARRYGVISRIISARASNANTSNDIVVSPPPSNEAPDPQTVNHGELRVTLNERNNFVLHADGLDVLGIDIESPTGALIPVADDSPEPFAFLLSNTPNQVTFGNLTSALTIDGSLELSVGWDTSVSDADLTINYGSTVPGSQPVPATLDFDGAS